MQSIEKSGLIWITGFSSSGKTTISRKVEFILRKKNYRTIFLDGDDLRLILGGGWGYERDKRMELAHIYFRMCSHLSSQGYIVIISAVAMFEEVSLWVRENIKNSMQVYLDVPSEIRLQRDARTKKIFLQKKLIDSVYDIPNAPDLIIRNYGDMSTDEVARIIVNEFVNSERVTLDYNRKTYWNAHYKKQAVSTEPSSFSTYVESKIRNNQKILEIGSGTGRDAVFFPKKGILLPLLTDQKRR